jgi:hypothetical protein
MFHASVPEEVLGGIVLVTYSKWEFSRQVAKVSAEANVTQAK